MAKDSDELRQDRSADRNMIGAAMDDYLRQGGLVSHVDKSGVVVALLGELPSNAKPLAKVLPFKARELAPTVIIEPAPVTLKAKAAPAAAPAPKTAIIIDIVPELRRIRADAERVLARLNAAAERRTA